VAHGAAVVSAQGSRMLPELPGSAQLP